MANGRKIVVNRGEVLDAWYEAQDAIIAETEARKEFEHLHKICEEKKRKFRDLIDLAEDYEDGKQDCPVKEELDG